MKTYNVKPEGIIHVRKRMLMFGAAALLIVLAGAGTIVPERDMTPGFGVIVFFVVILGGLGFRRGLLRMNETWPSYTLTVADDYILKRQSHYTDVKITRDEVTKILKSSTGEIVVKTKGWKKFIAIPKSLNDIEEVEGMLSQWKPIKQYSRAKTYLPYSLIILITLAGIAALRGLLRGYTPSFPAIFIATLVLVFLNLLLLWTLRRFPNLDERSKPKRWQFILTVVYLLLLVLSMVVFFALRK